MTDSYFFSFRQLSYDVRDSLRVIISQQLPRDYCPPIAATLLVTAFIEESTQREVTEESKEQFVLLSKSAKKKALRNLQTTLSEELFRLLEK